MATATGHLAGMQKTYLELIEFKKTDNRTAEEIINDTIEKGGLVVVNE